VTATVLSVALAIVLFALLGSGLWIALSLLGVGYVAMALFTSSPIGSNMATAVWGAAKGWELAALPLFIWMGEILFRSRLSEDMFAGLAPWLGRLPGRLIHVNIVGCGIFAAVSGSSAATAATIGKMSIPELARRGYDDRMSIGSLAGSGTLGLLIPPSIVLIVYGVAIDESIARLFIAGVLPGLMLIALFMGFVMVWAQFNPEKIPAEPAAPTLRQRIYSARRLIPVMVIIAGVIGSIYFGIASPTDAAAVGVLLSLLLAALSGTLTRANFVDGLMGATRTSCMIAFILAGAAFLSVAMGFAGLSPHMLLAALTVFFIVLGCFLDGISIVVLTTAVILPMVQAAGIDTIWFGIYLVLVVEMAQITPPVGFNLFVLQGLTGRDIFYIARAALPFFGLLALAVIILVLFPGIATFLPAQMTAT
jgi:C4-dicarboxylate transporter DctM subunit